MSDIRPSFGKVMMYFLFFVSGLCALIYEVVWSRMLVLVFGNTTMAATTVLTSFMAGLALGGWYWGRRVDRITMKPLLLFGCLELGIGIFGLLISRGMGAILPVEVWIAQAAGWGSLLRIMVRFLLCFGILILPTFLMGGTLAAVGRYLITKKELFASHVAGLYGINTIGAFIGAWGAGFFLIQHLGHSGSLLTAALLNGVTGLAAVGLSLRTERGAAGKAKTGASWKKKANALPEKPVFWILAGLFISGFCGIAYQIVWTRLLILIIDNSVYSFTIILMAFLLGIALGSMIISRCFKYVTSSVFLFALVEIGIGITAFAFPFFIHTRTAGGDLLYWKFLFETLPLGIFLPTLLMGAAFPLGADAYHRLRSGVGKSIGTVYAVNSAGCVLGGLAAGFLLIGYLGLRNSMLLLPSLNLAAGVCLGLFYGPRKYRVAFVVLLLLLPTAGFFLMPPDYFRNKYAAIEPEGELVYYKESASTNATIFKRADNDLALYLNGIPEVDTTYLSTKTFKVMGSLPCLLQPDPENALMITFGAGVAAGSTAIYTKHLDCVDLASQAREIAPFFEYYNNGIIHNKNITLYNDDARHFLQGSQKTYSVIISDATHPRVYDSWVLFTDEFYHLVRSRLAKDGIFLQWLPFHGLTTEQYLGILRTFTESFPHTSIWCIGEGYSLLLATPAPLKIDLRMFLTKLMRPEVQKDMAAVGLTNPMEILGYFMCGEDKIREMLSGTSRLMTDNSPAHLFFPFSSTFKDQYDSWPAANFSILERYEESVAPYLMNISDDDAKREKMMDLMRAYEAHEKNS